MHFIRGAIRVGVTVAVINAAVQSGRAGWHYLELRDYAQQVVMHAESPAEQMTADVLTMAEVLRIPVPEEGVAVTEVEGRPRIEVSYLHPVELFPDTFYQFPVHYVVDGASDVLAGAPSRSSIDRMKQLRRATQ